MKKQILLASLLLTLPHWSEGKSLRTAEKLYLEKEKNLEELATELNNLGLHFSSSIYAAKYIKSSQKMKPDFEKVFEDLVVKTGVSTFLGISAEDLGRHKTPTAAFVLGMKAFKEKNYQLAYQSLRYIPDNHRFSSEKHMIQGSAMQLLDKSVEAIDHYRLCQKTAIKYTSKAKAEKLSRYYKVLEEQCLIHEARIHYKNKRYREAIKTYDKISKRSYRWPYTLLEKAWANYYLEDYNRSLGLITTYRSPLLESYFFPEAEVLGALSYFRMCLYYDANKTIEQYYKVYRERSKDLKELLVPHKNSHTYFLKMILAPIEEGEKKNPFIRNLLTQIRKKVKFSVDLITYNRAKKELAAIKKIKNRTKMIEEMELGLRVAVSHRTRLLNHFVKKNMFSFINDIHRYSYELFNINLEISQEKRTLLYENKKLISDRSRGSVENVNRKGNQHFWDFEGEFWADELGDYSFGLKSNCKTVGLNKKKTAKRLRKPKNKRQVKKINRVVSGR